MFFSFQNILFSLCGSIFYFALGSIRIDRMIPEGVDKDHEVKLAIGAMAIINGFVYLADTALAVVDLKNDD